MKDVVAGIDIGGTNIIFGLVDKSGNVIAEDRLIPVISGKLPLYGFLTPKGGKRIVPREWRDHSIQGHLQE